MDSSNISNVSKEPSSQDMLVPISSGYPSQPRSADQIAPPVIEVSLTGQDSSPASFIHPAVVEIIPDQASPCNASQLPPSEILQNLGSAGFTQQSSSSSNEMSQNSVNLIKVTTPSLHDPQERHVSHTLAEDESTVSVLKPTLSSQPECSWNVPSIIHEPVAGQLQVSLRQEQDFDTSQDQFRVQQVGPVGDRLAIPWKSATVAEQVINLEQHTTTTVINVDKISPASIVLQKAQEDFSVITEDSATTQDESIPIDAVIETIEEYVDRATGLPLGSEVNEPLNKALLIAKQGPIGGTVQQNADWNFDVNLAFDMHIKKHSDNEMNKAGQNKPQLTANVQSGKFTVTSKGLAVPAQTNVSLIKNIPTPAGKNLIGKYQDTPVSVSSGANRWEDQNFQFSLNSDSNLLKVQYTEDEMHTVLQKTSTDVPAGFKGQTIQPVLNTQPMEQPLHIQNEMHRLGLHVQIDKAPEDNNVTLVLPGLSSGQNITNTSLEKNIAAMHNFVQKERVRLDLERRASLFTEKRIGQVPTGNKSLPPTNLVTIAPPEPTPVSSNVTGNDLEKTVVRMPPACDVDSVNPMRREVARIVILPNQLGGKAEIMVKGAIDGKSTVTTKKTLLVPIRNTSRGKPKETTDSAHVSIQAAEEGSPTDMYMAQTQKMDGDLDLQEKSSDISKEGTGKPVMTLKPLTAMTECELSVLQRPKKITRYFKEKAKNSIHQDTKQQNVQTTSQEVKECDAPQEQEGLTAAKRKTPFNQPEELEQEVSSEKDTAQFVMDDPNPTPVKMLRNIAECVEVKSSKAFTCQQCGRGFSHLGDYNSHVKVHKDGMPFTCAECGVGFRKSGHLINHSRRHTGEKPFACTVCTNSFGQLGTLKRHMRIHTGEKPYVCPTCNKSFSQLSYMKVHRRSHTGERPFKCDVCDHSFLQSGDLKKHKLRKHNAKKELPCPHCTKSFGDKIDIKRHLKTHDGKLVCKTCNKKFENVESAKIHKQLFHSKGKARELPHLCAVCDIGFKLKADLQSHMRTCHPPDIKKEKPTGRGKGKKRRRKRRTQQHRSEEEDTDLEEYMSDTQEVDQQAIVTVKEEAVDVPKQKEEEEVVTGTRKRKASKFQLRKLLPVNQQDRRKRMRRTKE